MTAGTAHAAATELAQLIADEWAGEDVQPLADWLATEGTPGVSAECERLAMGLAPIRRDLHGGGWYPVEDCALSVADLEALRDAGILRGALPVEAGSYGILFAPDLVLMAGRPVVADYDGYVGWGAL